MYELLAVSGYDQKMSKINPDLSTVELMQVAVDDHLKTKELTQAERDELLALLKDRGRQELEYGEELEIDGVRLIRRVTGAVGIYFE